MSRGWRHGVVSCHALPVPLLLVLTLALANSGWTPPRQAPAAFKSARFGLTFKTPRKASYCPLRNGWKGSDNGTLLFLVPPSRCGAASGSSTNRAFAPNPLPMLSISYNYVGMTRPTPCRAVGKMKAMGADRPVCEVRRGGTVIRSVRATYIADIPSEVLVTLVSTPDRLGKDMDALRRVTGSLKACTATMQGPRGGFTIGRGKPCPPDARWF